MLMRFPNFLICVPALLIFACQKPQTSETESLFYKGPQVSELVQKNQDEWLAGFVKDQDKQSYDRLVGFGDSLSDTGNLNRNTLGIFVNKRTYWEGRWSNGPVWLEYAAKAMGIPLNNYSVGAAETREKAGNGPDRLVIPGLGRQIDQFIKQDKAHITDKTLVSIWIGSNNYLFDGNDVPQLAVSDIKAGIEKLLAQGLKHFVIGQVGDLSAVTGTPNSVEDLSFFGPEHDRLLQVMIADHKASYPKVQVRIFNTIASGQKQVTETEVYGFSDTKNPCYKGDLRGNFEGEQKFCEDYLGVRLWDKVHPNTKSHCYYAVQLFEDLNFSIDSDAMVRRCSELDPRSR